MRTDGNNVQINDLFVENKIVAEKIEEDIEYCIYTSCGSISESFRWNEATERNVEIVNDLNDQLPDIICQIHHILGLLFLFDR
jgi:hypothetical protein